IPKDEVRELGVGKIYTGLEALDLGLVDKIGSLEDAVKEAMKIAEIKRDVDVIVYYDETGSYFKLISGSIKEKILNFFLKKQNYLLRYRNLKY
ncbi:MAG: S49 family peptidase, partial [Actinomycetia bacterium]|nr:S49 family peptidase [Actinomycetes bacterium]